MVGHEPNLTFIQNTNQHHYVYNSLGACNLQIVIKNGWQENRINANRA